MPFNSSIWHALWILLPLGVIVYLVTLATLEKGCHYYFDAKHNDGPGYEDAGNFEPHSARYQDLAKLVITLSSAAIAFLIGVQANNKPPLSEFAQKTEAVAPIVVGFFASSIAFLIFFMVSQNVWYEQYCHSADHSTYKRWKYALSMALGWTGLTSFIVGFVWLARNLFHP
jgi:hypothetical protein